MPETLIPGKDAPLEQSIARIQTLLADLGFTVEAASWLNPVPNAWSVHLKDTECPVLFSNGKGRSKEAALASALGEFVERLATGYFFADYYLGHDNDFVHHPAERWFQPEAGLWPNELLANEQLRDFYDPDGELDPAKLFDIGSDPERGVCALPYTRQSDGETLWFPVNLIGNIFMSNGMSAGNTLPEAQVQGLSEVFERYVKFRIIAENIALPDIPDAVIARFPKIQSAIDGLTQHGFALRIKDASLGGKYPVINVTLLNPEDGSCFASFGAHPKLEVALERTVTELLQGRDLDALQGFARPSLDANDIADPHNMETHFIDSSGVIGWAMLEDRSDYDFVDWDFSGNTEQEREHLLNRLHDEGHDVYILNLEQCGLPACRILVPGVSDIYPPEELTWENNNDATPLRAAILSLTNSSTDELAKLYDALNELGRDDTQPVAAMLGIVPEPGSAWATLRLGELRLRLALACDDHDTALELIDTLLSFGEVSDEQARRFRCLEGIIDAPTLTPRKRTLIDLYGQAAFDLTHDWVMQERLFDDLGSPTLKLEGFTVHHKLWHASEKGRAAFNAI